jgi:hypothetical protein
MNLARLEPGDQIPWKMGEDGPLWLTVTAVLDTGKYEVEYPDGHHETLTDSE